MSKLAEINAKALKRDGVVSGLWDGSPWLPEYNKWSAVCKAVSGILLIRLSLALWHVSIWREQKIAQSMYHGIIKMQPLVTPIQLAYGQSQIRRSIAPAMCVHCTQVLSASKFHLTGPSGRLPKLPGLA